MAVNSSKEGAEAKQGAGEEPNEQNNTCARSSTPAETGRAFLSPVIDLPQQGHGQMPLLLKNSLIVRPLN